MKTEKPTINKDNFLFYTTAVFAGKDRPDREPDFVSLKKFKFYYDELLYDDEANASLEGDNVKIVKSCPDASEPYFVYTDGTVSSSYWYTDEGVYRESDHWGIVGGCKWSHEQNTGIAREKLVGFCRYSDFLEAGDAKARELALDDKRRRMNKISNINRNRRVNQYIMSNKHLVLLMETDIIDNKIETHACRELISSLAATFSIVEKAHIINGFNERTFRYTTAILYAFWQMMTDRHKIV